jgi:hypothetical protein
MHSLENSNSSFKIYFSIFWEPDRNLMSDYENLGDIVPELLNNESREPGSTLSLSKTLWS